MELVSNILRLSSILLWRLARGFGGNGGIDTGSGGGPETVFAEVFKSSVAREDESSTGGPVVGSGGGAPSSSTSFKFNSLR